MSDCQVIAHNPGPQWRQGVDLAEQPGVRDHLATLKGWLDSGRLIMGGPFLDDQGGGMAVVRFDSVDAARQAALADPAVQAGLLTVTVRPWFPGLSAEGVELGM
jgi:uncharacterized protein YciI